MNHGDDICIHEQHDLKPGLRNLCGLLISLLKIKIKNYYSKIKLTIRVLISLCKLGLLPCFKLSESYSWWRFWFKHEYDKPGSSIDNHAKRKQTSQCRVQIIRSNTLRSWVVTEISFYRCAKCKVYKYRAKENF